MKNQKSRLTIREIQDLVFQEYRKNGYEESWTANNSTNGIRQEVFDIAELGLIITEVSEAIEEIRNNGLSCNYELADIIIRVLNFSSRKDIDIEKAILEKNKINLERGLLHGKSV